MKFIFKLVFVGFFIMLTCLLFIKGKSSTSALLLESNVEALASSEGGMGACYSSGSLECDGHKVYSSWGRSIPLPPR